MASTTVVALVPPKFDRFLSSIRLQQFWQLVQHCTTIFSTIAHIFSYYF
jgi:hypothetical protein